MTFIKWKRVIHSKTNIVTLAYGIWLEWNQAIFKDKPPNALKYFMHNLSILSRYKPSSRIANPTNRDKPPFEQNFLGDFLMGWLREPPIKTNFIWEFFDGVVQDSHLSVELEVFYISQNPILYHLLLMWGLLQTT